MSLFISILLYRSNHRPHARGSHRIISCVFIPETSGPFQDDHFDHYSPPSLSVLKGNITVLITAEAENNSSVCFALGSTLSPTDSTTEPATRVIRFRQLTVTIMVSTFLTHERNLSSRDQGRILTSASRVLSERSIQDENTDQHSHCSPRSHDADARPEPRPVRMRSGAPVCRLLVVSSSQCIDAGPEFMTLEDASIRTSASIL